MPVAVAAAKGKGVIRLVQWIIYIFMGIFLLVYAGLDIREQQIPVLPTILCGILLLVYCMFYREMAISVVLGGLGIGLGVLLLSFVTQGQIGLGDGMILCLTGLTLGFPRNFFVLLLSLILAAIVAVYCIVIKKCGRKYSIPFLPFVFLSYILVILTDGGSI